MAHTKRRKGTTDDQGSASKEGIGRKPEQTEEERSQITEDGARVSASQNASSGRYQGSSGRTREDEDLKSISSQADNADKDLEDLREEEITGSQQNDIRSVSYSDTDEDEDEGLGDGNLGRTVREGLEE
jgi:hypothetical protein